ncbi:uncharacterized protein LOC132285517 [Cornus florida]|uniref:uncharacterized protein LOC132285517 n=1 Tax=Cornus florida TaxID=4283 RepID=UPI00289A23BF|nr:uncharacterized protein LOC132285517 [Cornus florida]
MRGMFGARWFSRRFIYVQNRPFCTTNKPTINNNGSANGSLSKYDDAHRQLDNLDFMTAAKILFTTPPNKKKFGIDFHLVQLFFACMPSLAVYLVAQYARYEMRRMEAELEQKKRAEEEAKAKEEELNVTEEKEAGSDPEILEVKVRLDKLEEAIKEIVVESKKPSGSTVTKNQEVSNKKHSTTPEPSDTQSRLEASSAVKDHDSKQSSENVMPGSGHGKASGLAPVTDASQQNQKGTQDGGLSPESKK